MREESEYERRESEWKKIVVLTYYGSNTLFLQIL